MDSPNKNLSHSINGQNNNQLYPCQYQTECKTTMIFVVNTKTGPQSKSQYVVCQVCGWYGYPQEKIILKFEGIRPENDDGYIDIFTEYDYNTETGEKGAKHIHKYKPELAQKLVDLSLKIRNDDGVCQE